MNTSRKGSTLERTVVNALKAAGYEAARTAGSKSPFDVVGVTVSHDYLTPAIILIQCKSGKTFSKSIFSGKDIKIMKNLSYSTHISVYVVVKVDRKQPVAYYYDLFKNVWEQSIYMTEVINDKAI